MRRILLLAVVLLGLATAGWWILRSQPDLPGPAPAIDRAAVPQAETREALAGAGPGASLRGTAQQEPGQPEEASPSVPNAPWTLTFQTLDPDGSPVAWLYAEVQDADGETLKEIIPADESLPTGTAEVTGNGVLVVRAHQRVPWASALLTPPPSGTRHLVVHFERGEAVAGRVYEQDGVTPLRYGSVTIRIPKRDEPYRPPSSVEGRVGADGQFSVPGLPPGPVHLVARATDWTMGRPVRADAETGDDEVRLVLGPQGAIAFVISDEATGLAPRRTGQCNLYVVTDGEERLWSMTGGNLRPDPQPEAKPSSWYRAVPGRTYRFRIKAHGYEPSEIVEVDVPDTGGKQIIQLALRADTASMAHVTIRVHTSDGALPAWLPVTRLWGQGSSSTGGMKVENERFVLDLMPGPQRLSVGGAYVPKPEDPDTFWIPIDLDLDLAPGDRQDVDVWLERGGYVVIVGDPNPRPRKVRFRRGDEVVERWARWGSWGKKVETGYLLGALPPGKWTLEYAEREKGLRVTFTVEREKVTRLAPKTFEAFVVEEK